MRQPPSFCGYSPVPLNRLDTRWLRVKDERLAIRVDSPGRFSKVQKLVNGHIAYTRDMVDHWDTPKGVWLSGRGDCEEFAIAKRAILIESGVPDEDLFFVLVNDLIRREYHAILIACQGDKAYILDLQGDVYSVERARDFTPMFAYSGSGAWMYGKKL